MSSAGEPVHLDTHVVVWLDIGAHERLSERALAAIDRAVPVISPMVMLELSFLHEIGRLTVSPQVVLANVGATVSPSPFAEVVGTAMHLDFTRDPFDRVIVSNAMTDGAQLVTRDQRMHAAYELAVW